MCRSHLTRFNRAAALSLAYVGLAACGGGDDAEESSSTTQVVTGESKESDDAQPTTTPEPAPTTTRPPASTAAPSTSTSPPTSVVDGPDPGVVIAESAPMDTMGYGADIVPVPPLKDIPLSRAKPFDCSRSDVRDPAETKGKRYKKTAAGPAVCAPGGSCC